MDKYSIQLIPPRGGDVKQIRVEGSRLKLALFCVAAFVIINLAALGLNIYFGVAWYRKSDLVRSNARLSRRLDFAEARAESLENIVGYVVELTNQVRDMADLPSIRPEDLAYGIGGPQLDYDPNEPLIVSKAGDIDRKLDSLLLATRRETEALADVYEHFENKRKLFVHTPTIWPMHGYVSSGFGKRLDPFTGVWKMHEGIDICARKGTPVRATADGRVRFAGWYHGYGKTIRIDHIYYETRYAHLDDIKVTPGQRVKRGDIIGTCGNSGYTTGVHLHYEVRISGKPVDPKKYLYPEVVVD
ncbi:hypothetical protein DRQ36_02650 [bacterium]|nr:MAG: hypothetical protein DRQ36_02650 [bacterium]